MAGGRPSAWRATRQRTANEGGEASRKRSYVCFALHILSLPDNAHQLAPTKALEDVRMPRQVPLQSSGWPGLTDKGTQADRLDGDSESS